MKEEGMKCSKLLFALNLVTLLMQIQSDYYFPEECLSCYLL